MQSLAFTLLPDMDGLTEPLTGQRIRDLMPLADWIAPMLYHNILLQPPRWVGSAVKKVIKTTGVKTCPLCRLTLIETRATRPTGARQCQPRISATAWTRSTGKLASAA